MESNQNESLAKKYIKELKNGTKTMFKEFFNKRTRRKQIANMLTFSRLITPFITVPLCIAGISYGIPSLFIACSALTGMGAITDALDGRIARHYNVQSEYGKLLDAITDKIFVGIIGINLLTLNPMYLITLVGELLIATVNSTFTLTLGKKHKEYVQESSKLGKYKTILLFAILVLGYLAPVSKLLFTITSALAISTFPFQCTVAGNYIKINLDKIKAFKENSKININDNEKSQELAESYTLQKSEVKQPSISERIQELNKLKASLTEDTSTTELEHGKQKTISRENANENS